VEEQGLAAEVTLALAFRIHSCQKIHLSAAIALVAGEALKITEPHQRWLFSAGVARVVFG